ncbi:MAG: hypothetical protein K1W34_14230 [Lachnospiraceae bacterium]
MTEVHTAVANSTAKEITVSKIGNMVDLNLSVKLASAISAYQVLFTLPAEYRPSKKIQIAAAGTSAKPYLIVMTNGKVQVQGAYAANEFVVFGRTYIL